ncbi:cyclic nucleotide-gated cation channel subunit a [Holotrichia oblita]|uniref:Cyclic nucleotide-gated cation channel subunit a n=1 Tax=Holotrichia oblita TaxID=644536 RepID=A0ACB9TQU3_HOLOL|nr:cyclic nucleotide-gated cation channel subunit a [Holotrichia oblita]
MDSTVDVNELKAAQEQEKQDEAIIVYGDTYYKFNDIFLIAAEPVWYLTILSVEFISIWIYLYTNIDIQCHTDKWYAAGMRGNRGRHNIHIPSLTFIISEFLLTADLLIGIDIVLSMWGKLWGDLDMLDKNLNSRPLWIVILEVVSIIPYKELLKVALPEATRLQCVICLIKVIRYSRICYFFHKLKTLFHDAVYLKIIEMLCNFIAVLFFADNIFCNLQCFNGYCSDKQCENFRNIIRLIAELTAQGQSSYQYTLTWNLVIALAKILVFVLITNLTVAFVSVELIHRYAHQVAFVQEFLIILSREETMSGPRLIRNRITEYYTNMWQTRGGYTEYENCMDKLHPALRNELKVDCTWLAYKHSSLLRHMDLPFLRELSNLMRQEFTVPGQIICDRNQLKDKMIYVVSGTIQLLSEEDGESPILALTSGTCLGESSLLISYNARSKVRSKDFCELCCLHRKDFFRIVRKYPKEIAMLKHILMERYEEARKLKNFSDLAKETVHESQKTQLDVFTIIWIKNTLHKLMSKDKESARRHEFQNIYLVSETNESSLNKMAFSAKFLNTMVIAERIDVDLDTVFVKPTYPCILRPNSFMVNVWEIFILTITIFVAFLVPHTAFIVDKPPSWYGPTLFAISLIFWIDLYIQLSIGVVTRGIALNKFITTAKARMNTFSFWMDFLSCIPCEILTCITLPTSTNIAGIMHVNRLTKLWRVENLFRKWEKRFGANFILIRFAKFAWINLYTTFIFWCFFHVNNPGAYLFIAIESMTGTTCVDVSGQSNISESLMLTAGLTSWIINLFMRSNIVSAYVLMNLNRFKVQLFCKDVINTMKSHALGTTYVNRVNSYLLTQWVNNECLQLIKPNLHIASLPETISHPLLTRTRTIILMREKFFQILPEECVRDISITSTRTYILIIWRGCYEIRDDKNKYLGYHSKQSMTNFIEASFRIASVYTFIAKSYVKLLLIDIKSVEKVLVKYDSISADYKATVNGSQDLKKKCMRMTQPIEIGYQTAVTQESNQSFYHFGYNLTPDSYEEFDYYLAFDKLYPFSFVHYLLLRTVILPHGKFLIVWESFRVIFAILANLLFYTTFLSVKSQFYVVFIFIDFTAICDLYIRLHVAYYNENGILIKHPLCTAKHYLTHGFLIDALAICPLSFLFISQNMWFYLLTGKRLLQLHRYVQFIRVLQGRNLKPVRNWYVLTYIPLAIILFNLFGNWLIIADCAYVSDNPRINLDYIGLNCSDESILNSIRLSRPITRLKAHLYGVYSATLILLNISVEGNGLRTIKIYILVAGMSIFGYYIRTVFIGKLFAVYSMRHNTLISYQQEIRALRSFLNSVRVNYHLIRLIIDSYEYKWSCVKGKSIHTAIAPFYHTLSTDILYAVYGHSLYQHSIFTHKTCYFYRNLIKYMKHDIIKTGGYLTTINDVTEFIHILYSGKSDVLSPDGTVLDTLMEGSIFGNIENLKRTRLKISVIAACHVEILSIPACKFHKILAYYPKIHDEYHQLKVKYLTYIPRKYQQKNEYPQAKLSSTLGTVIVNKTINPNSKLMEYWSMFNLVYTCYAGIIVDLYQFGSMDYSPLMFIILYSSDFLYGLHFLITQRTAYENEAGILVTDINMIKKHHRQDKVHFTITIISLIPIDIIVALFMHASTKKYHLISLTRCNRFLRLTYIFQYFENLSNRLNINLYITNFMYIFMWTTLFFCALASFIGFATCHTPTTSTASTLIALKS